MTEAKPLEVEVSDLRERVARLEQLLVRTVPASAPVELPKFENYPEWKPETRTEALASHNGCTRCGAPPGFRCVTYRGVPVERGCFHANRSRALP